MQWYAVLIINYGLFRIIMIIILITMTMFMTMTMDPKYQGPSWLFHSVERKKAQTDFQEKSEPPSKVLQLGIVF